MKGGDPEVTRSTDLPSLAQTSSGQNELSITGKKGTLSMKKIVSSLALTAALLLTSASPSLASGAESGTAYCYPYRVGVTALTTYDVYLRVGNAGVYRYWGTSEWRRNTLYTYYNNASWYVGTNGAISYASTYAFCW